MSKSLAHIALKDTMRDPYERHINMNPEPRVPYPMEDLPATTLPAPVASPMPYNALENNTQPYTNNISRSKIVPFVESPTFSIHANIDARQNTASLQTNPITSLQDTAQPPGLAESARKFTRIHELAVKDATNFTKAIQLQWCETLLTYAFDFDFLAHYNINAELLKTTLKPEDILKNQKIILEHSFKVLTKLVALEYGPALYLLGTLYSHQPYLPIKNKTIVEKNDAKALEYYVMAAKSNHSEACYRAGISFEFMKGVPTNDRKQSHQWAIEYYLQGAEKCGNFACMYKLGIHYLYELKDPVTAINWFERATGSPYACYELGKIYEFTILPQQIQELLGIHGINQNCEKALHYYYKSASELQYPLAQWKLGYCYEHGQLGLPPIPGSSVAWYHKAATAVPKGNPLAMLSLAGWYFLGIPNLLEPNDAEAFKWLENCCQTTDGKIAKAEYIIANFILHGIGCQVDVPKAQHHLQRAMKLGYPKAKELHDRLITNLPDNAANRRPYKTTK